MPTARAQRLGRRTVGLAAAMATLGVAALSGALPASAQPASAQPGTARPASARVTLRGSAPQWTRQAATGAVAGRSGVAIRVFLTPKGGEAALENAAAAVSTPGSAGYRRFITPAQYRAAFEPSNAQLASVKSWLSSSGFQLTGTEASRRYVTASGNAAAVQKAFGVSLKTFRLNGSTVKGPDGDATVPAGVAAAVSAVDGLTSAPAAAKPQSVGKVAATTVSPSDVPPPGFNAARPCSSYYGQLIAKKQADYTTPLPKFNGAYRDYAVCGYEPSQFRTAYGVTSTPYTGKGVTVGIIDAYAAPTIYKDANEYATTHGDPAFTHATFTQSVPKKFTNAAACGPNGWWGEETLDVEAVHAIAPAANVRFYAGTSCLDSDLEGALARALDENKVSVISNSYGEPDQTPSAADVAETHQLAQQAALQGITLLFSSGDDGDNVAAAGLRQASWPASDPSVTGVGGTSTAIGPDQKMLFQTGWGTTKAALSTDGKSWGTPAFVYGAGGGFSTLFNRPAYQNGVVQSSLAGRAVPDIAADGDPNTGMLVGETQTFPSGVAYGEYRIGGTSLASPLTAGMVALATERSGKPFGFLNPAIYAAAKSKSAAFTDVLPVHTGDANVRPDYVNSVDDSDGVVYSVRTFDQDSSLTVTKGWDDVTGVGTPNAAFITSFGG
jgi:subtilase family serine protease